MASHTHLTIKQIIRQLLNMLYIPDILDIYISNSIRDLHFVCSFFFLLLLRLCCCQIIRGKYCFHLSCASLFYLSVFHICGDCCSSFGLSFGERCFLVHHLWLVWDHRKHLSNGFELKAVVFNWVFNGTATGSRKLVDLHLLFLDRNNIILWFKKCLNISL